MGLLLVALSRTGKRFQLDGARLARRANGNAWDCGKVYLGGTGLAGVALAWARFVPCYKWGWMRLDGCYVLT